MMNKYQALPQLSKGDQERWQLYTFTSFSVRFGVWISLQVNVRERFQKVGYRD